MPYEVIEHTADIGLRITGRDLKELFTDAARGFFGLMTDPDKIKEDIASKRPGALQVSFPFHIRGEKAAELFFNWLRELLFVFSTQRLVFWDFLFERFTDQELLAAGRGAKFDPRRHEQRHEVKAVTYHGYRFEKNQGGWFAEVIFDI